MPLKKINKIDVKFCSNVDIHPLLCLANLQSYFLFCNKIDQIMILSFYLIIISKTSSEKC